MILEIISKKNKLKTKVKTFNSLLKSNIYLK